MKLVEDPLEAFKIEENSKGIMTKTRYFLTEDLQMSIIKSTDLGHTHSPLLHVSCARGDRKPNWDEIDAVKNRFFGKEEEAMIILPAYSQPLGEHPFAVHLWPLPDCWRE